MVTPRSFKDLIVWQKAVLLAKEIYKTTRQLPQSEQYGLVSQLNRASVSIPSNIAEGSKRGSRKDFAQFLRIASGSAAEVETQLIIVKEVYPNLDLQACSDILEEVQKMLTSMIKGMR